MEKRRENTSRKIGEFRPFDALNHQFSYQKNGDKKSSILNIIVRRDPDGDGVRWRSPRCLLRVLKGRDLKRVIPLRDSPRHPLDCRGG